VLRSWRRCLGPRAEDYEDARCKRRFLRTAMTRRRNKRRPSELAERLARGSHAKDFGIGGKPVLRRFYSRGAGAGPVPPLEVRSSTDGSKDKDRATDHEADAAAHQQQLFDCG